VKIQPWEGLANMYAPIQMAAIALSLVHPSTTSISTELRGTPIPVSGVVCTSPRDLAGLFQINLRGVAKTTDDLVTLGRASGYGCLVLKNTFVFNWGPVSGPEGKIEVAGGKPVSIVEIVDCNDAAGPEKHYYLIAKSR
jgi:hypothetical protein